MKNWKNSLNGKKVKRKPIKFSLNINYWFVDFLSIL